MMDFLAYSAVAAPMPFLVIHRKDDSLDENIDTVFELLAPLAVVTGACR